MKWLASLLFTFVAILTVLTRQDMLPVPKTLNITGSTVSKPQLLDRHMKPITITYKNHWNMHDIVRLHEIPEFLQEAFIVSEDKRFYDHRGVDWTARIHAVWQNIAAMTKVRGASTISEQTVKMLHPRTRTIWTRWLEGWEAAQLEKRFSKNEIIEFYMNQVPYSAQRRGVVQAARYYFDRDLETLNQQEMMTLAVLVRAPSRLDPLKHPEAAKPAIERLAKNMRGLLSDYATLIRPTEAQSISVGWVSDSVTQHKITNIRSVKNRSIQASHFAKFIYNKNNRNQRKIQTTLDLNLQNSTQIILEKRLQDLKISNVKNGAVLIVDHKTNEILSWVVAGDSDPDYPGSAIDAVTTPRQPGSTLKPLLYTLALGNGFTAATLIDDSPLSESVGVGMHTYHNYSRIHYGNISLREALGNSLNIPAVKTLQEVGTGKFLKTLHKLGIESLKNHPDIYGDGLALGNGEITLYELVQAYTTLARHGQFKPLVFTKEETRYGNKGNENIFTKESTSLIANILSDPKARTREFGSSGLLNFPIQTAVKTGTSNDYRDAWAVGFNHRYTVGVWMGNMDRDSMKKITGSAGPAFVLRSVFSELNQHKQTKPLYLSPELVKTTICKETGLTPTTDNKCTPFNEWFISGTEPTESKQVVTKTRAIRIQQPSPNLQMAMDPRIPDHKEHFRFSLNQSADDRNVKWILDGQLLAETSEGNYQWKLEKGAHELRAEIWQNHHVKEATVVHFLVK